jgi:hypothetical protein
VPEKKGWIPDLLWSGRDKKARERIRKEQDTESIDDLILQGRFSRAQQVLELRIAENDQDVHSHIKLAELQSQRRQNEDALRHYLRAAQLLSEDGFFDKSLALLKTARKLAPKDANIDAMEETVLRSKELDMAAWSVRKGKASEGSKLSASIELEALWRRMSESDFVQSLAKGQLEALMDAMELCQVPAGEYVAREGEQDPALYLIASGLIQARLDPLGRDLLLRNFGPGQLIGESVLFERRVWPASYKAAHNSQLLRLGVAGLQRALNKTTSRRQLITALSSQRNDQQVAALASSVAATR